MKKVLFTIVILLLSITLVSAQGKKVEYDIQIGLNCDGIQGMIMESGFANEGDDITFPSYTVPDQYETLKGFQPVLDAFAGAKVEIPVGTLKEDVKLVIMANPFPCEYENIKYRELLGLYVKVIAGNIEYPPFSYFEFNDGMYVTLKLKAENVAELLQNSNITLAELRAWFVSEGFEADLAGINLSYTVGDEWIVIELSHFSKISIGVHNSTTDIASTESLPKEFELYQNYPNPFNPSTTIAYSLPESGETKLIVYNSIGVEIKTLISEYQEAGNYKINFDASDLSTGVYLFRIKSNGLTKTRKMILLK